MAKVEILYKVMVNIWNSKRGIVSDNFNEEYSGIVHYSEAEAKKEAAIARKKTSNDLTVNYVYIDRIEVYG